LASSSSCLEMITLSSNNEAAEIFHGEIAI
jgi:hypothetical protein